MTLVIVGHEFEKESTFSWSDRDYTLPKKAGMKTVGLFAVADSSITTPKSNGMQTVLGGFRKIYSIPVKVWQPYFNRVYFNSYLEVYYEAECFVAIAGSTLTAQHVLNLISEHLSKIRISYERSGERCVPGRYVLIRHCQRNELEINQGIDEWDECMFTPRDYVDLVTAGDIAKIVEYSINEALSSARKYKLDEASLKSMYSEFAVGIFCPKEKNHQLFVFRMQNRMTKAGLMEVFATNEKIEEGCVAVLGMKKEFEAEAQAVMQKSLEEEVKTSISLFEFLNKAIDKVRSDGSFAIDRPSVCKLFQQGHLKTILHIK